MAVRIVRPSNKLYDFMEVELTQFLCPDGRKEIVHCNVPDTLVVKYDALRAVGCRLTAEVLMNEKVSLAIEHPEVGDFAMELCDNGPGPNQPPIAVARLIEKFDLVEFERWLSHFNERQE